MDELCELLSRLDMLKCPKCGELVNTEFFWDGDPAVPHCYLECRVCGHSVGSAGVTHMEAFISAWGYLREDGKMSLFNEDRETTHMEAFISAWGYLREDGKMSLFNEDRETFERDYYETFERDFGPIVKAAAIADDAYEQVKQILRHSVYWRSRVLEDKALNYLKGAAKILYEIGFESADTEGEAQLFKDLFAEAKEWLTTDASSTNESEV